MCGNVYEICREALGTYNQPAGARDGERPTTAAGTRIIRGAGFHNVTANARSAFRSDVSSSYFDFAFGLRPSLRKRP